MLEAVNAAIADADVLVMAAAVSDFRAAHISGEKIKKGDGIPQITLEAAPDILGSVGSGKGVRNALKVIVGFAAESQNLIENASAKLKKKNLDLIVANDISAADAGFGVETNRVTLLFADGRREALPLMGKDAVAARVMGEVESIIYDGRKEKT
jgi:phosphopantothenoylcysteine decarboxylase/phosphopantothenate--cysteine ligase